jgi:PIN domain nuclease of toxin-antitoxin system
MNLLLDTHTFLWYISGNTALSTAARKAIENNSLKKFVSMASLWEISIKVSLGKLSIKGTFETILDDLETNGFELLPILFTHTVAQKNLIFHHRDPFDRMLIGQAISENLHIVGRDEMFDFYFEKTVSTRIW